MDKQTGDQIDKQTGKKIDKQTGDQIDKQTGKKIDKQTGDQIDKQTGDQIDKQTQVYIRTLHSTAGGTSLALTQETFLVEKKIGGHESFLWGYSYICPVLSDLHAMDSSDSPHSYFVNQCFVVLNKKFGFMKLISIQ